MFALSNLIPVAAFGFVILFVIKFILAVCLLFSNLILLVASFVFILFMSYKFNHAVSKS